MFRIQDANDKTIFHPLAFHAHNAKKKKMQAACLDPELSYAEDASKSFCSLLGDARLSTIPNTAIVCGQPAAFSEIKRVEIRRRRNRPDLLIRQ